MNIDPKKLAEEAQEKLAGLGAGNLVDQAKEKLGDVVDHLKGSGADGLKDKAADMLEGLADKLRH